MYLAYINFLLIAFVYQKYTNNSSVLVLLKSIYNNILFTNQLSSLKYWISH